MRDRNRIFVRYIIFGVRGHKVMSSESSTVYMTPCTNYAHVQCVTKYAKVSVFGYLKSIERWRVGVKTQLDRTEETDETTYLKIAVEDPLSAYRKQMNLCIFGIHKKPEFTQFWSNQMSYIGCLVMISNFKKNDKGLSGDAMDLFVKVFSSSMLEIGEEDKPVVKDNTSSSESKGKVIMKISDIEIATSKSTDIAMFDVTIDDINTNSGGKYYAKIRQGDNFYTMYMWKGHPEITVGSIYDFEGLHVTPKDNRVFLALSETSRAKDSHLRIVAHDATPSCNDNVNAGICNIIFVTN